MDRWVNTYSVMLINLPYNDALNDARIIIDELEKTLKKLGYLSNEYFVRFNMTEFLPGNRDEEESLDKFARKIDWEVSISVPTWEMTKNQALKMAEICKYQIEKTCKEFKYLIFQTIRRQNLGYIKFDQCRLMSGDDEMFFRNPDI